MGLFNIFTRTKGRDELLGKIAPLLTESRKLTFTADTSENELLTDINWYTRSLIRDHGNDPAIVEPVKTILQTLGNQGVSASYFKDIKSSARDAYYSYKMHRKHDTGLLREIEKFILSHSDAHDDFTILEDIRITSPYAISKQESSKMILVLAQIQSSTNGNYRESLEKIDLAFEYLQPKEQEEAIDLINKICADIREKDNHNDAIQLYLDFIDSPIPHTIREKLSYNFITLYPPSEIKDTDDNQFMNVLAHIYAYADDNTNLQYLTYIAADKLATEVAKEGDFDAALDFRRDIILQMKDGDALLPMAIAAWKDDLAKIKSPNEIFHKCKHSFSQHNLRRSYAPPMFENILLHTINKQIPVLDYTAPESMDGTIENLLQTVSYQSQLSLYKTNDDLAANVVMNAFDLAKDKIKTDYGRLYILRNLLQLENLSPPIIHRIVNAWNEASLLEAKSKPRSTLESSLRILQEIKNDFIDEHQNDFFDSTKNIFKKIAVEKRIVAECALDNLVAISPYLLESVDKLKAAANIIDFTQQNDPRHQQAIKQYVETYKSAKENQEYLYETSETFPKDTPKEIKRMFKEVAVLEKAAKTATPKPPPTSPQALLEELKKEI